MLPPYYVKSSKLRPTQTARQVGEKPQHPPVNQDLSDASATLFSIPSPPQTWVTSPGTRIGAVPCRLSGIRDNTPEARQRLSGHSWQPQRPSLLRPFWNLARQYKRTHKHRDAQRPPTQSRSDIRQKARIQSIHAIAWQRWAAQPRPRHTCRPDRRNQAREIARSPATC